jgi:hypothetical protein
VANSTRSSPSSGQNADSLHCTGFTGVNGTSAFHEEVALRPFGFFNGRRTSSVRHTEPELGHRAAEKIRDAHAVLFRDVDPTLHAAAVRTSRDTLETSPSIPYARSPAVTARALSIRSPSV